MSVIGDVAQSSGTTIEPGFEISENNQFMDDFPQRSSSSAEGPASGEEQPLESHEVIELQSFSERKVWIEEKIKFLEQKPPIKVFAGLDAVRSSAEHIPELPTQEELSRWIMEHDAIEKETEVFDRGELTKLRQLTKAATQRNLSPADTDVIELTLTTIYALDKLLHLLRDRSENLELLGIRLSWEESRIAAWVERRNILDDLQIFLESRARWSPLVYEDNPKADEPRDVKRRSSITSLASVSSDTTSVSVGFSRGVRFKLAELLSRDAAQFAARVTGLRHGRILTSGRVLDRLIENSRKPVPEEFLDEQDRLEEKGIADLEHIGKFVMNMVMQWRKADEIYVETVKDKTTAQNLLEEIETANLHHPTPRQSTSFISRADGLIKRLAIRGNPAFSTSLFPSPEHLLFGDQKDFNRTLVQFLSNEIASATDIARKVDAAAKTYHSVYEAVKRVDSLTASARELSATHMNLITRIREGVSAEEGDGSPPSLASELCLDPSSHSVFLALLPSLLSEAAQASERSIQILSSSIPTMLNLNHLGISAEFTVAATTDFKQLESLHNEAQMACDDIQARSIKLREARRIQILINKFIPQVEDVMQVVMDMTDVVRWRRITGSFEEHYIDQSAGSPQDEASLMDYRARILDLRSQMVQEIDVPLASLSRNLEEPLKRHLRQNFSELREYADGALKMLDLLESIREQARVMKTVHKDFKDILLRIEHMGAEIDSHIDRVLTDRMVDGNLSEAGTVSQHNLDVTQTDVASFTDGLNDQIILVSHPLALFPTSSFGRNAKSKERTLELSFDLETLNDAVRSDSNSFSMTLRGQVDILNQKFAHFHLICMAKELDATLVTANIKVNSLQRDIAAFKSSLSDISARDDDTTQLLSSLSQNSEKTLQDGRTDFDQCFLSAQALHQRMEAIARTQDPSVRQVFYVTRHRAMEGIVSRYRAYEASLSSFTEALSLEQKAVLKRLENYSIENERRLFEQRERLAAEEQERIRAEQEKLECEERERLEEIQRLEALRPQTEQDKIALEEAEKARLENERAEAEASQRLEEIRLADEEHMQGSRDRIAEEEAEIPRLKQERVEVEGKLLLVEQQLAEGRRTQAEKDRAASEKLERGRQWKLLDVAHHLREGRIAAGQTERGKLHLQPDEKRRFVESLRVMDEDKSLEDDGINAVKQDTKVNSLRRSADEDGTQRKDSSKERPGVAQSGPKLRLSNEEDIFTSSAALIEDQTKSRDIQAQILTLRRRLRSMNINEVAHPRNASANLPTLKQHNQMNQLLSSITLDASLLPPCVADSSANVELASLRAEIEPSAGLMQRVEKLAQLTDHIQKCDVALSDLLEHIDRHPASSGSFVSGSLSEVSPEEQLTTHLTSTRSAIESMTSKFASVSKDSRATAEKTRIVQTWSELEDMALERLGMRKSRPPSTISSRPSSGRNSSASIFNTHSLKKSMGYSNLSVSSHKRLLVPAHPTSRRVVSGGSAEDYSRPSSQMSTLSSNRAVSSPFSPSIYGSTFASRQRTSSLNNSHSTPVQQASTPARTRSQTAQHMRDSSPTGSEVSSYSRPTRARTSSTTSMSNWSRSARRSIVSGTSSLSNTKTQKKPAARKTYVADPKSKLDVAVGDVINKLPVGINIEGVSETWEDQSGKYWIGNQDPKLCFCRILRSQTVMVRVGGGWSELSRFIKDHFADSFRILPESPPRPGLADEKWISSATLLEASVEIDSSPAPPRTPEPMMPFVPSFALSTPNRQSPLSLKSSSPSAKGSPLTPLQFMRRAEVDLLRPVTPTKSSSTLRARNPNAQISTLARTSVWRP